MSVSSSDSTCWMLIRGASTGDAEDREDFAKRYVAVVRAYLAHRWKGSPLMDELDDAVQDVFVECFRHGGVLDRMQEREPDSFRAFLFGVTRNVALRLERRLGRKRERLPAVGLEAERLPADDPTLSRVFDRAWAKTTFRQAAGLQEERAKQAGDRAMQRVELLRLRSRDGLPIREIARLWNIDAATLHKEYARARREFKAALRDTVAFHCPGASAAEIDKRCSELVGFLNA